MRVLLSILLALALVGCATTDQQRIDALEEKVAVMERNQVSSLEELLQLVAAGTGANKIRAFVELEGGGTGALDAIDGDSLAANDLAFVYDVNSGSVTFHKFNVTGSCSTDTSPHIIYPDSCAGDTTKGRWELMTGFTFGRTAEPKTIWRDSGATDYDDNVYTYVNCTTTGTGAEDCDWELHQQIAGVATKVIEMDADGGYRLLGQADGTTDGFYDGMVRTYTVDSGASTSFGQAMHLDTDGEVIVADADVASQGAMPAIGLVVETGTGAKRVLLQGLICETDWAWTVGGPVYVSADPSTTEGLSQTAESTTGDTVQLVGIATAADCIEVNMGGYNWVEVP